MSAVDKPPMVVGIDLGTTYSLVSALQAGRPVVLPNGLGEILTPSAVSVDEDGAMLVGASARARAATHPQRTALSFKRDMGTDREVQLGDQTLRPEQLSALVLKTLAEDAAQALGATIAEAVVTVPAYFGELQRRATRDACEIAGLKVERILNEPTAAALAYGLHETDREIRAVVLDLGGGTFDVTVLEIMEGVIEIQASAGDSRLGGEDFVDALLEHARAQVRARFDADVVDPTAVARLREACELAKRRLTGEEQSKLAVVDLKLDSGRRVDLELDLERDACEQLWQPLLRRIELPIRRALRDADATAQDIEEVLLVGGATRMPCIAALAAQLFGRLPSRQLPPDEAVAMGAAVQAALKSGDAAVDELAVTDVAPFSLGISSGRKVGSQVVGGLYAPVLERGTVLPASRMKTFGTMERSQREIQIEVFQGEHSLCADNQKLGEYMVRGIPANPRGEEDIEVRFTYDLNGILEVESTIVSTRKKATLVIEKSPGRLSETEVAQARKAMQRLKFHPRDALPNRTALARADALYAELTGPSRDLLGEAIGSFRTALEGQELEIIDAHREALVSLVGDLRLSH